MFERSIMLVAVVFSIIGGFISYALIGCHEITTPLLTGLLAVLVFLYTVYKLWSLGEKKHV